MDFDKILMANEIDLFTDAAKSDRLGFGCVFGDRWTCGTWNGFVKECNPSIEYLDLYALALAIELWAPNLKDRRLVVFCDNEAVVNVVNHSSTGLENCMVLIRLIVLTSMMYNVRFFVQHVRGVCSEWVDALSRGKMKKFFELAGPTVDRCKTLMPEKLWPPQKLWRWGKNE